MVILNWDEAGYVPDAKRLDNPTPYQFTVVRRLIAVKLDEIEAAPVSRIVDKTRISVDKQPYHLHKGGEFAYDRLSPLR